MVRETGWHQDPNNPDRMRYWSGQRWTKAVQDVNVPDNLDALPPPTLGHMTAEAPSPHPPHASSSGTGAAARRPLALVLLAALAAAAALFFFTAGANQPPAARYWELQPHPVWLDASAEYYEFSDSELRDAIVGQWNIDALPFLESAASITVYDWEYNRGRDGTLEDMVSNRYRSYVEFEGVTVLADEFGVNAAGLQTWRAWSERECGAGRMCDTGSFLVLAEDRYLWATVNIRDSYAGLRAEVDDFRDTVRRAS